MILPRFYCPHCKKFRKRKEVKKYIPIFFEESYECKYCGLKVLETTEYIGKIISSYRDWERGKEFKVDLKVHHR